MEVISVCTAVLTFNRIHLLRRTLASMDAAPGFPFQRAVVDGGSSDEQQRTFVAAHQPYAYVYDQKVSVGRSMNTAIDMAVATGANLIVFSADDYEYRPNWLARLVRFWQAAPKDIGIATLNWEPAYSWNTVEDDVVIGLERTLIRATVPGSSWSFRADSWRSLFGPIQDRTGGEDMSVCTALRAAGYRLAALDLTDHIGEKESAWGNRSWERAEPLRL